MAVRCTAFLPYRVTLVFSRIIFRVLVLKFFGGPEFRGFLSRVFGANEELLL